jgi:hypothetical protein
LRQRIRRRQPDDGPRILSVVADIARILGAAASVIIDLIRLRG